MVIKPFQALEIFEVMGRFLDLEHIYEPVSEGASSGARDDGLTAVMLADLTDELLQELRGSTLALDGEAVLETISRIADHAPEMAAGLKGLVDNYQMAELRNLLEDIK